MWLMLTIVCCSVPVRATILTEAQVGDTVSGMLKYRGEYLFDWFRFKKKYIYLYSQATADSMAFACELSVKNDKDIATPLDMVASKDTTAKSQVVQKYWKQRGYAVLESKEDSLCRFRFVHHPKDTTSDWHVVTATVNAFTGTCEGTWQWYNKKHQMVYEEHYAHNAIQGCESYTYDKLNRCVLRKSYVYKKSNVRDTLAVRYSHHDLLSASGTRIAKVVYPVKRYGRTPKGNYDYMPTAVTYYDADGNTIQYANTDQVTKAVQQYVEKQVKQHIKLSTIGASAAIDVMVTVDTEGKITVIRALDNDVFMLIREKKNMERRKEYLPPLQAYLRDELPDATIQAKPVLLDKQPVECILIFTVVIH